MKIQQILFIAVAICLFLATLTGLSLPGGFYLATTSFAFGCALYGALVRRDSPVAIIGFLMIALVFNPFITLDFDRQTTRIFQLASAAAFLRLAFRSPETVKEN